MTSQCHYISSPLDELIRLAGFAPQDLLHAIHPDPSGTYVGDIPDTHKVFIRLERASKVGIARIYQADDRLYINFQKSNPKRPMNPYWIYNDMSVYCAWFICSSEGYLPEGVLQGLAGHPVQALTKTKSAIGNLEIIRACNVEGVTVQADVIPQWIPI